MISLQANGVRFDNIQGIILDKDGTLTDSNFYWKEIIIRRASQICEDFALDKSFYSEIIKTMGFDITKNKLKEEGPIALKSREEVIKKLVDFFIKQNMNISYTLIDDIFMKTQKKFAPEIQNYVKPINGAIEFVKYLKNFDIKIALVTSDIYANAEKSLQKLELLSYFDAVIGGDLGIGKKSDGLPAKYVCNKLDIQEKNVIAIGDAYMDHNMSLKANLSGSILVSTGQIPLFSLLKINQASISNLKEIHIFKN